MPPRPLLLLGPQRPTPNLTEALRQIPGTGPVLTLTAGWRHDEGDLSALHGAIGPEAVNLPLYAWYEELAAQEPAFFAAYKRRQADIRALKELYRLRLHPALDALRRLLDAADTQRDLVRPQLLWALGDLRDIDDQLLKQSEAIRAAYPEVQRPWRHPAVARRRQEALEQIRDARAVVIAGGHVAVLRNRIQFFGLHAALSSARALIAWSAGAMVLTERIVLFYDDPPHGSSDAELFDKGFGLARGCLLLPHARRRLRLDDPSRVSLLATRFAPSVCIGMENGSWVEKVDGKWVNRGIPGTALLLGTNGAAVPLKSTREGSP